MKSDSSHSMTTYSKNASFGILKNIFLLLCICTACGRDPKEKKTSDSNISAQALENAEVRYSVHFADKTLDTVYAYYTHVKNEMVGGINKNIRSAAKKMEKIIPDSEGYSALKATTHLISLTRTTEKQRDFFKTLSEEVAYHVRQTSIQSGQIYKQFCPMAFNGDGGFWLSEIEEIKNPFFGDKMLRCGQTEEIIK